MGNDTYIIGMKNEFSMFDLHNFELHDKILFISDELGFILYNKTNTKLEGNQNLSMMEDTPFGLSLYILLEKITKQELP